MDDESELIEKDLDYVLLFDEHDGEDGGKKGPGCFVVSLLLFPSVTVGLLEFIKLFS